MITDDKITEIFCATDEFSKKFDEEIENMPLLSTDGKSRRRRAASMSDSEIMTVLIMFHFGTFDNFKHYYLHFIRIHLKHDFPDAVSYNRFVELESRVAALRQAQRPEVGIRRIPVAGIMGLTRTKAEKVINL